MCRHTDFLTHINYLYISVYQALIKMLQKPTKKKQKKDLRIKNNIYLCAVLINN